MKLRSANKFYRSRFFHVRKVTEGLKGFRVHVNKDLNKTALLRFLNLAGMQVERVRMVRSPRRRIKATRKRRSTFKDSGIKIFEISTKKDPRDDGHGGKAQLTNDLRDRDVNGSSKEI